MDLSNVTPRRIEVFLTVAAEENMMRAARRLGMPQPSLSRQMAALETEIGARLFVRTGRGVELTEAGKVFATYAAQIDGSLRQAAQALGELTGKVSGEVRLGLPPTVAHVIALPLILALRERYQDVAVTVMEGYSGHVLDWLSRGRLDLGIIYETGVTSDLQADLLHEEELFLIVSPEMAPQRATFVTGEQLTGMRMILPSRAHGLRQVVEARLARGGLKLDIQLQVDGFNTTLKMVEAGLGCTILPRVSLAERITAGTLVALPIREPVITRKLLLATSPATPPSRAVNALAAYARTYLHRHFAADRLQ